MRSEEREVKGEKMSTQKFTPKKPQIGKWVLIAAIAVSSLALLLALLLVLLDFDLLLAYKVTTLYLPLSFAAAILYLTREEQAAAARVWGILGGFALVPFGWMRLPAFFMAIFMAIGGAALALRRPKLAGVLMLVGAIMGVAGLVFLAPLLMNGPTGLCLLLIIMPPFLAASFLIPGGILALTSRAGQGASKKMVIGAIAALFVLSLWRVLLELLHL